MTTATNAAPIFGNKLYQKRARAAFPLLVRQAEASTTINYSSLALELGMPNPRNLNYVLGCIGQTLEQIQEETGKKIPPIQCLVVNKNTNLPGEGIGWFVVKQENFSKLSLKRRREIIQTQLQRVYAYPRWQKLLEDLCLTPVPRNFTPLLSQASSFRGGGESQDHLKLKRYVANNPSSIGIKFSKVGETEYALPSGDSLDVSFRNRKLWVSAEVKSKKSNVSDVTRGIFQCIKYRAVMDAVLAAEDLPQNSRSILVLGGSMPLKLVSLANLLGVEFLQNIGPQG